MKLRLRGRTLELGARPVLMGVINTNDDSVSDRVRLRGVGAQVRAAEQMVRDGASMIDVGGDSSRTDRPSPAVDDEIRRVVPVVERLTAQGIDVSIDTWKPRVARAAVDAGAVMINDVSGLLDEELADLAAETGAALVVLHTAARPKRVNFPSYADPVAQAIGFLRERVAAARRRGVDSEQIVIDPGPDFGKGPRDSIAILSRLDELRVLERPILLAVSNKYFLGVIGNRPPDQRLPGTLAAIDAGVRRGASIVRVHDVAEVAFYLETRAALSGDGPPVPEYVDDDRLKWLHPDA
jgi:dihydropteroate synthase